MPEYRIEIRLEGPIATPLYSGTIFGHLCWSLRHQDGEAALETWLRELEQTPFLISDAFPRGWLPVPLLAPARRPPPADPVHEAAETAKRLRKAEWLRLADFLAIRGALNPHTLEARLVAEPPPAPKMSRTARNSINRLTGTTPASGGLFFVDEWWPHSDEPWEVWANTGLSLERFQSLFTLTASLGYGADAGIGRGRFSVSVEPAPPALFTAPGSNRRMTLSHGSLTGNMAEPRYRIHTHFGKLGSVYATGRAPFKFPLALLRPGATFRPLDSGPFGELLGGVHKDRTGIRHNAWHLTVPYKEKEAD